MAQRREHRPCGYPHATFLPQSRLDARSAPSRKVFSFGHTIEAATHSRPAKVPKPQSVDAITRSRLV